MALGSVMLSGLGADGSLDPQLLEALQQLDEEAGAASHPETDAEQAPPVADLLAQEAGAASHPETDAEQAPPVADLLAQDLPAPPADLDMGGMPRNVFETLCRGVMADVHRCHTLTSEEREAQVRHIELMIPGGEPGRVLQLVEDPTGAFSARATGSILWPAAGALIEWLEREALPTSSKGVRAVEFGAGLGAVGLYLARYRGCEVVLTDLEEALPLLQRSVRESFADGAGPKVLPLNWGNAEQLAAVRKHYVGCADLVVGSDIIYRPALLPDLVSSAAGLLVPGGKLLLAFQERETGEAANIEAVVGTDGRFRIASKVEAPPVGLLAVKKASPEVDSRNSPFEGKEDLPKVFLWELVRITPMVEATTVPTTPEEVEAEFERITGVKVEPFLPRGYNASQILAEKLREESVVATVGNGQEKSRQEKLIDDFLERNLASYLCDIDEELKAKIEALPEGERPKSEVKRRAFAETYYANVAADRETGGGGYPSAPSRAVAAPAGGNAAATAIGEGPPEAARIAAALAEEEALDRQLRPASGRIDVNSGTEARICMKGLDWQVDISEGEKEIAVTVSFDDQVWESLQGGGSRSFSEAVDFELADKELRVLHVGTTVLELILPLAVDPSAAATKISSRKRRVTVRAPLR